MQASFVAIICLLYHSDFASTKDFKTEKDVEQYLQNTYEKNSNTRCNQLKTATWNYETNLDDNNKEEILRSVSLTQAQAVRKEWIENFRNFTPKKSWSEKIKRQFGFVKKIGVVALDIRDYKNLTNIVKNMTVTFQSVKLCPYNKKKCRNAEMLSMPDLKNRMQESRNSEELLYIWTNVRDLIGNDIKLQFEKYVDLSNKAAKLNGLKDTGQMWRSEYESNSLYDDLNDLWDDIRPLYNELHKYVIKKMRNNYKQLDFDDGLIPAHILGDMWAEDWSHLFKILKPFPKSYSVNITQDLIDQEYDIINMFRTANSFYTSLGLLSNELAYDSNAMIQKPVGRRVDCQAKTFDFCNGKQYRFKMCANLTQADFFKIHGQMAEVQYYQQYRNQPYSFRTFANPAFAKAIGGAVALSASTLTYLSKIGLTNNYRNTYGSAVNRLMEIALKDVASLPYNLLVDKWRWDVFSGDVKKWNSNWWKYREYYQKVKPPLSRNNDKFDPGAQYYIVEGLHSIDNFLATILQFQIYKALCIKSGQYNPAEKTPALNRCDFSESREVGNLIKSALSFGKSKHWKEVLKSLTDQDDINASGLLEYFQPLYDYLKDSNEIQKEPSDSTKKPNKKKKKKTRSRSFPVNDSLDFEDGSFDGGDEDFQDSTDNEVTNKSTNTLTVTPKVLQEWTETITEDISVVDTSVQAKFNNSSIKPSTEVTKSSEPPTTATTTTLINTTYDEITEEDYFDATEDNVEIETQPSDDEDFQDSTDNEVTNKSTNTLTVTPKVLQEWTVTITEDISVVDTSVQAKFNNSSIKPSTEVTKSSEPPTTATTTLINTTYDEITEEDYFDATEDNVEIKTPPSDEDFTEMYSTVAETSSATVNGSVTQGNVTDMTTTQESSIITKEIGFTTTESNAKNYSIDFVYHGNLTTVSSVLVEVVTYPELELKTTTGGGIRSSYFDCRLSILLLLIIFA